MPSWLDWLAYIPQQWVGLVALTLFAVTLITHLIEKSATFAKLFPLGTWWHERAERRSHRADWIAEDNEVIAGLQKQIEGQNGRLTTLAAQMLELEDSLRCFRAWSIYDARYHHRLEVRYADSDACEVPRHHDFFEFERIWRNDPVEAARLSDFGGGTQ